MDVLILVTCVTAVKGFARIRVDGTNRAARGILPTSENWVR